MGHNLKVMPANRIVAFKDMDLQCTKCGCTFRINVTEKAANFLRSCELEQGLRERNPEGAKELPILVKEDD
jgi:hypothetical protein